MNLGELARHGGSSEPSTQLPPGLADRAREVTTRLLCETELLEQVAGRPESWPAPSTQRVVEGVEALKQALFPVVAASGLTKPDEVATHLGAALARAASIFPEQIERARRFAGQAGMPAGSPAAEEVTASWLATLPSVRRLLVKDVWAAYEGDPAATTTAEVVCCYPSFLAITYYRLAHALHRLGVPLIPRLITERAHSLTGIDIHPAASIGESFFIDHGTGVVIGETTIIGDHVRLYQSVTLGARSFPLDEHGRPLKGIARHPIVEDEVIIYAGATILGRVVVGKGSVVGGNVSLTHSLPPGSRVTQATHRDELLESGAGV